MEHPAFPDGPRDIPPQPYRAAYMHPRDAKLACWTFEHVLTGARAVLEDPAGNHGDRLFWDIAAFRRLLPRAAPGMLSRVGIHPDTGAVDTLLWQNRIPGGEMPVLKGIRSVREQLCMLELMANGEGPALN